MQCRSCNYEHSRVVDTYANERTNQIIRRRECIKCGKRFSTQEHIIEYRTYFKKRAAYNF